jgi:hypothetical protein
VVRRKIGGAGTGMSVSVEGLVYLKLDVLSGELLASWAWMWAFVRS